MARNDAEIELAALSTEHGVPLRMAAAGKVHCDQCSAILVLPRGDKSKAIRQHLKSHKKLEKKAQGGLTSEKKAQPAAISCRDSAERDEETTAADEGEDELSVKCWLCAVRSARAPKSHAPFITAAIDPPSACCHAPVYTTSPSITSRVPFFTKKSGSLPEIPTSLVELLDLYCVGKVPRLPNVDINNEHVAISSLNQAGKLLMDAAAQDSIYWAAFAAPDLIDPTWWPCEGEVPGYTQVIIGSGATDIGVHQDKFFPPDCAAPMPVNTYITMSHGAKQVIMLPPECAWVGELPKEFPTAPSKELIERIVASGGFYFEIRARKRPITLFVPRGWWHWLLGKSDFAVIFGSSRF